MPNPNTPKTMGAFFVPPEPEPEPSWPGCGVHKGVSEQAYRAHPAQSHSGIRHWIKPRSLGRVGVIGHATHTLTLEGRAALDARYLSVDEDFDLRTREGKERATELIGDSGKELLRHKERALVERMFAALNSHELARKILDAPGENEVSLIGKFEGFEQEYKARLDMVRRRSVWDLKTTNHVNEQQWLDSEVDYGYTNQGDWYSSLNAALAQDHLPFGFVCVSKREPHNVWIRQVPNQLMALGRKWREDVLTLYERYVPKEMRNVSR